MLPCGCCSPCIFALADQAASLGHAPCMTCPRMLQLTVCQRGVSAATGGGRWRNQLLRLLPCLLGRPILTKLLSVSQAEAAQPAGARDWVGVPGCCLAKPGATAAALQAQHGGWPHLPSMPVHVLPAGLTQRLARGRVAPPLPGAGSGAVAAHTLPTQSTRHLLLPPCGCAPPCGCSMHTTVAVMA